MYPYELRPSAARIKKKLVHLCYPLWTFNVSPFIEKGKAVFVCSAPFDPLWTNSLPLRAWERTIALLEAGSPYIKHFLFSSLQNQ